ncbi:hypothetical protein I4U23_030540 [Adineta vaga]|nr:hypothetical protein I4U23_030540 [Adineta vaga]
MFSLRIFRLIMVTIILGGLIVLISNHFNYRVPVDNMVGKKIVPEKKQHNQTRIRNSVNDLSNGVIGTNSAEKENVEMIVNIKAK